MKRQKKSKAPSKRSRKGAPPPRKKVQSSVHPAIQNGLGTFEMLRRFGFTPDELFAGWSGGKAFVILRTEGHKDFAVFSGNFDRSEAAFHAEWMAACVAWNTTMTEEERNSFFIGCEAYRNTVSLLRAMRENGIEARAPQARALLELV